MKKKSAVTLCFVVLIALLLNYVAFFGYNIAGFTYKGVFDEEKGIKKGIDLAGGSVITFQADTVNPTDEQMNIVESIFQTRLTNAGYTEARISKSEGGKITVEIPSVFETDKAAELLGDVAKLTFRDADGNVVKTDSPKVVASPNMVTRVRSVHPENASSPMLSTSLGIVISASLLHLQNANAPILVTPSGMVIVAISLHPWKDAFPIAVTLLGITTPVK